MEEIDPVPGNSVNIETRFTLSYRSLMPPIGGHETGERLRERLREIVYTAGS